MATIRGNRRALLKLLALLGVLAALLAVALASAGPGLTTRVSVDSAGNQATGLFGSFNSAISADGRFVAFYSHASNLVAGDTNGKADVFVHDRQAGATTRISVDSAGAQANEGSFDPAISADGHFVAFESLASNLVAGDTNGKADVFVHDRLTGTTERVSVDSAGNQATDFFSGSRRPAISADGRFVTFDSTATLVAGDTNNHPDVFVHDRQTGATTRVSVDSVGNQTGGGALPAISGDGRFVAFLSDTSDLVPGDTNGALDVFVHDRQTGATTRVSVDSAGNQEDSNNGRYRDVAISGDGRFVAFASDASNLVAGDTNGTGDVFVHDRQTGATTRVSVDSAGGQGNNESGNGGLDISGDGRFVAFESVASNLIESDTIFEDVFVHDRLTGATTRVSVDSAGRQADHVSTHPSISDDGRFVAFESLASNLVAGDTNGIWDIFVHDRGAAVINVTIDIKPGSDPNSIKLGDTGSVPVAIFSTVTFDATSIDVSTLQLNSASVRLVGGRKVLASVDDINGDSLADLVVQFDRGLLDLTVGDGIGTVTGSTLDGQSILGTDSVRVIE